MQVTWIAWNPDPAILGEMQLLLLATLHNQMWALNKLIVRKYSWAWALIAYLGRRRELQDADVRNAQQDGMLVMRKALLAFNCLRSPIMNVGSVRAFLRTALKRGFYNFVRSESRKVGRRAGSPGNECGTICRSLGSVLLNLPDGMQDWRDPDPRDAAERAETITRVQVVLGKLDETKREICQAIGDGIALRRMPAKLHLSYPTIRRRRDEAFSEISELLPEFCLN